MKPSATAIHNGRAAARASPTLASETVRKVAHRNNALTSRPSASLRPLPGRAGATAIGLRLVSRALGRGDADLRVRAGKLGRARLFKAQLLHDQEQGAILGLAVDTADIFAHHPQEDELQAADKQHGD